MVTINLPGPTKNPPQLMVTINLRGEGVRMGTEPGWAGTGSLHGSVCSTTWRPNRRKALHAGGRERVWGCLLRGSVCSAPRIGKFRGPPITPERPQERHGGSSPVNGSGVIGGSSPTARARGLGAVGWHSTRVDRPRRMRRGALGPRTHKCR
jgi:hypothetical protein